MAVNIKNPEVERLLDEVASLAKEGKTEAIRNSLLLRRAQLSLLKRSGKKDERLLDFLARSVWSEIPKNLLGKKFSKSAEEKLLGFGRSGV